MEPVTVLLPTTYPAVARSVGEIRDRLAAIAGVLGAREELLESIRVAASEAASNAVEHAYGQIHVAAAILDRSFVIEIAGGGQGFGDSPHKNGLGRGLAVMLACAEQLTFEKGPSGGVRLRLHFDVQTPAEPRPRHHDAKGAVLPLEP